MWMPRYPSPPSRDRRPHFARKLAVAAVAVSIVVFAHAASAAKPEKLFPDFHMQKDSLGSVALITDLVVVENVIGTTEKVYLQDCRRIGAKVLDTFAEAMKAKGYPIGRSALVSVGNVVDPKLEYRILQTWEQHTEDDAKFPVMPPPFHVDSTLYSAPGAADAWHAVFNDTWAFKIKKKEPAPVLDEIAGLKASLGTDYAFVIVVVGSKVPFGKQFGQSMLSGLTMGSGSSGNVTFSAGVNFTQYSGTGISVAMVDCRDGRVLWADTDFEARSLKEENLDKLVKDVLKRLP